MPSIVPYFFQSGDQLASTLSSTAFGAAFTSPVPTRVFSRPGCGTIAMSGASPPVTFVTMLASKLLSPVYSTVTPLVLLQSSKTFCRASASEPVIPPAIRTVPPAAADPPVLPPLLPPSAQPARANAATPMTARGAIQRRRDIPM